MCRSLLLLVLIWPAESLPAQDSAELLAILAPEAEDPLPEEDLLLIEDILRQAPVLSAAIVDQIAQLSFVTETDLVEIQALSRANPTKENELAGNLNPATRLLLEMLLTSNDTSLPINYNQLITFHDDVRYRWRTRVTWPKMILGLNLERDPGERLIADHVSGYLEGRSAKINWIIGDHQILYGYGLHLWRSTAGFKSYDTYGTALRRGRGIQPYRTSHEAWGLRGLALQKHTDRSEFIFSVSSNSRGGEIDSTGFPRINLTGLHLSDKSIQQRANLRESVLCGVSETRFGQTAVGVSAAAAHWNDHNETEALFFSYSIYLSQEFESGTVFTEFTRGYNQTSGFMGGLKLTGQRFSYFISLRSYSPGFISVRSNPLSEWSGSRKNEWGFYQGISFFWQNNKLTCYSDIYHQLEPAEGLLDPLQGSETAWRWEWKKKDRRYRLQGKRELKSIERGYRVWNQDLPSQEIRDLYKLVHYRNLSSRWNLKLQINYSCYSAAKQNSSGFGWESRLRWVGSVVGIETDWVNTRVDDFDSRLYFWDLNLPNEMRSRVYSRSGNYPGFKVVLDLKQDYRISGRIRWLIPAGRNSAVVDYEGGLKIEADL